MAFLNIHELIKKHLVPPLMGINKRVRFVISVVVLEALMLFSTFFFFDIAWIFIPIFIFVVYIFTYFSILEGVEKIELLTLFIMPIFFTIVCYMFLFLFFPVRWIVRLPYLALYGASMYFLLLSSNIFNVGAERSLQLYRVAFSVNYFYQTIVFFLSMSILFSFKLPFYVNTVAAFCLTFILAIQLLWSVKPKIELDQKIVQYAFLIAFLVGEIAIVLSFVSLNSSTIALFLSASYYSLGGLIYHYLDERLFKTTVREYIIVLGFVTILVLLSIQW